MTTLTPTTQAILGLIALKPMSTYDLAKEMQRNLHFFWRKAERGIYAQARRLVAEGLASERSAATGKRSRTVYAITPAGEAALRAWLETPPAAPALDNEVLLRLLFSPLGRPEDLDAALQVAEREAAALIAFAGAVREGYLAGKAPFQTLAPSRVHLYLFLLRHAEFSRDWARATRQALAASASLPAAERQAAALAMFRDNPPA